jgi:hypothetical protein
METPWEMRLQVVGNLWPVPNGYWRPFGKCPNRIRDLVGNAFKVEETFWEMPKEKWIPVGFTL